MISIKHENIPIHLKNSMFFEGLDCDDNESFEIQEKYFKKDLIINSKKDFISLIETLKFWDCKNKPEIEINTLGNLILNIEESKKISEEMEANYFFQFLNYDFISLEKHVKGKFSEYEETMKYIFDDKITEKKLFKIYSIYEISKKYLMQYLFSKITDSIERKIFVLICILNNDGDSLFLFNKGHILNNYEIWRLILRDGADNVLRYMLKKKIVYGTLEKNVNNIERRLLMYQSCKNSSYQTKKFFIGYVPKIPDDLSGFYRCISLFREYY